MFMLWVGVQDFAVNQFSLINISLLMKVKGKLKFLVGQVMRATKGRANPKVLNDLVKKKLEEG